MRTVACAAVLLFVCPIAFAQHMHHVGAPPPLENDLRKSPCWKQFAPAVLDDGLQKVPWPAITGNDKAKLFFNQGMTQYYGFNYEEALRNFRGAAAADPAMAMASWGIALAAGPNINLGMDENCHELAKKQSANAVKQAKTQPGLTPVERALIDALPLRYDYLVKEEPPTTKKEMETQALRVTAAQKEYSDALGRKWKDFMNDTNFGALYAESVMELHAWDLYDKNHIPTSPDTDKIVKILTTALDVDKNAVGANHYWIHVAEAGPKPQEAQPSAKLLQTLVLASGHLVHMPSHISLLMGDYNESAEGNRNAATIDVEQYGACCSGSYNDYRDNPFCPQLYYGHYLSHNYFFDSVSATFSGQSERAVDLACKTRDHVQNFVTNEPGLQRYMTAPLMTLVVNRNWDEIANYPEPPAACYIQPPFKQETGCHIVRAMWHWAQGMRLTIDSDDMSLSRNLQLTAMADERMKSSCGDEVACTTPTGWGNNTANDVLMIAELILKAHIAWREGNQDGAISFLNDAVKREDNLTYDEPPQWFAPARESLGGVYLWARNFELAKQTFDDELKRHPKSGRALYGKMRALIGSYAKKADIDAVTCQFCNAWEYADYKMTDDDLWPTTIASGDPGIKCPATCPLKNQWPSRRPSVRTCNKTTAWPAPLRACLK